MRKRLRLLACARAGKGVGEQLAVNGSLLKTTVMLCALVAMLPAISVAGQQPATPAYVAIGDSITNGAFATQPISPRTLTRYTRASLAAGTSYAAILAESLARNAIDYQNLGINGASALTVLQDELPSISPHATLVTLYVGINDERDANIAANPTPWRLALQAIVENIHRTAPRARLIVANVPNLAWYPAYRMERSTARRELTDSTNAMDAAIDALTAQGIAVVDLRCNPEVYRWDGFADELHPNDAGYRRLAQLFLQTIRHARPPRASCPPYTTVESL